jgi:hypothetical protein
VVRLILAASIVLGALTTAAAAPVPAATPARAFGDRAVLTAADLAKLDYSAPVTDAEALRQHPNLNGAAVALHLPKLRFHTGEPIPAYFVVRNRSDKPLGLDMRLDLFTTPPGKRNSCAIRLVNRSAGEEDRFIDKQVWACGSGSHVTVPEHGYYVAAGDLARGATGPLPPGEYECVWNYSFAKSNAVRFSVIGERPKKTPGKAAFPDVRFLELTEHGDRERKKAEKLEKAGPPKPVVWRKPGLHPIPAGGFAAALGVGLDGKYYPDVRRLPESDQLLQVTAEWTFGAAGDRLRVHLRPTRLGGEVVLPDRPYLYLQVEGEARDDRSEERDVVEKVTEKRRDGSHAPLTIEVRMPQDWRHRVGVAGRGRVAVLVSSTKVEPQYGYERLLDREKKLVHADEEPVWAGLLRTPFTEIDLPKVEPGASTTGLDNRR